MKTTGIVVRTWNDAPITRRDSDGYADATAMCQANGKLWGHYRETHRTADYITALADATGLGADQLIISTKGGPAHLQGTWIHPRLAVDLARWISPQFAVWMDGWFLDAVATAQRPAPLPVLDTKACAHCGKEMYASNGRRTCSNACRQALYRIRRDGSYSTPAAPTPALPPGVHVVANTPRQASWLWAQAVEDHVSRALMVQVAASNHRESPTTFQLHLLPAA